MRSFLSSFAICFCLACTPQKHVLELSKEIHQTSLTQLNNGQSTVSIIPHKKAVFKKDAFDIGYVTLEDSKGSLFKFEYVKKSPKNVADANYSEIVYIDLPENFSAINSNDIPLEKTQILFGRFCYCKGSTGFYQVKNGELSAKMIAKNQLKLALKFKLKQVPHLISTIQENIHLK
ncbi:MAG: hypothetical protein COB98_03775 [Flavobacteriaceae bacterium]|nr:MAG: hypothetical protein COB98_03775 [Flavobacteriaceae bacterium]